MEYISNAKKYREAWIMRRFIEQTIAELGNGEKARAYLDDLKRSIREYRDRPTLNIIKEYGIDGFIELDALPEQIETELDAEEYFEENMRLVCTPSQYDCTGQLFTSWHKLVKRRGRWYVYHAIACDC